MSNAEITPQEALVRLGASTGEAVAQVFEMYAPGLVERGDVTVLPDPAIAFDNLPFGAVAASVSYVNGVSGANVFVMNPAGARTLAGAMGVPPPEEPETPPETDAAIALTELELSAVSEAANQMMAAAASAISVVLGQEVEISPPETRVVDDSDSAIDLFGTAPHATSTTFLIGSEACRLIQLVPSAFVVRMARAIDELALDQPSEGASDGTAQTAGPPEPGTSETGVSVQEALEGITLRVWAELGRTQLPLGSAVDLPLGAVVDLDCAADAPVDIFVNGLRFAQGQLLVTDDGEWAVSLDALRGQDQPAAPEIDAHPQVKGALT
jgi:flagellar motor switch protein FliN/FliY